MTRRPLQAALLVFGSSISVLGSAADPTTRRIFVACPVVRDTPAVPCWLASDGTQTYFLGIQNDISAPFHPPQLKHKVLVEGTLSEEPQMCGGLVLNPIVISVLPAVDLTCDTILPAQGYSIKDPPRGPGPANRGKRAATEPPPPAVVQAADPAPPADPATVVREQTFTVSFSFDGLYMNVHEFPAVVKAARYLAAAPDAHIEVIGYRTSIHLSNGELLVEAEPIAEQRARKVRDALIGLGVLESSMAVRWQTEAEPADSSPALRRAEIIVRP